MYCMKSPNNNFIRFKYSYLLCFIFIFVPFFPVVAQDNLNRQLILVRPYEPSVTDAQKITALPNLKDSFNIKPAFEYSIRSRRIDTRFDVSPISPAKLQPLPQLKLYHGYIKVGAGAIPNALGEVTINTVRNKNYAAGAFLKYDGAFGKVKLENNDKVFAGNTDLSAKIFGQKFFYHSVLYGELGVSGQTVFNYGYDAKTTDNTGARMDTTFAKSDIRKNYTFADANIGIRSSYFKTEQLNYDVKLNYQTAINKFIEKYSENTVNLKAQLDNNMFGGNLNLDIYNRSNAFDSLRNNIAADINPWFMLDNDSVRFQVGVRVAFYKEGDGNVQLKLFPKIEFQFTLLKDIFIPFVGIDGNLSRNTYRNIVTENPFITPGLAVPVSSPKLQIYAGLKGTLSTKLSYYLRADFTTTENEFFFVNDTSYSQAQNYFTVVTDDLNTFSVKSELYFNPVESVDLGLKAAFFSYQPTKEKYAWHKPGYTIEFLAKYNLRNKIIVNFDVLSIGKRYAKAFYNNEDEDRFFTLRDVVSFNLGVEYRYTKSFSLFLKINNISAARYERWNFYPSQRFNMMGGFTYSL